MTQPTHDVLPDGGSGNAGGGSAGGSDARPPARRPSSTRPGLLPAALLTATFVAIAVAAALTFVGLPYVVMSPGPATNILGKVDGKPLLSVEGATTYPTSGTLDFTTVSVDGGPGVQVTVFDLAQAWLSGSQEILPEEQVFPPAADRAGRPGGGRGRDGRLAERRHRDRAARARPHRRRDGRHRRRCPTAARARASSSPTTCSSRVDGDPATSSDAVRAAVQRHQPGDTFPVVVRRDGKEQTVTAKTAESDGRTVMGVGLRLDYDLPVDVTLRTGNVGGPVGRADVQPGHLRRPDPRRAHRRQEHRRHRDAWTTRATVGPIGGIRQKLIGARRAGADYFLAPADNCDDVEGQRARRPAGGQGRRRSTRGVAAVRDIGTGKAASLPTCG